MATTTNFGWTTPDDTDLVKDGAAAIRTLGSAIDTSLVDLKGGTTGQLLSKNSNTDMDFTWIAAAGGVTLISETVASANSSLALSSIPQTYKHLILTWHGIQLSANNTGFGMRFENDSGSNYACSGFGGETANSGTTYTVFVIRASATSADNGARAFGFGNDSADIHNSASGSLIIYNYASTTKLKYYEMEFYRYRTDNNRSEWNKIFGTYKSQTAIDEINIYRTDGAGTFSNITNTSIRLYGVA